MGWDCHQVEEHGERQVLCVELVHGKQAILCTSLNPADLFLGLCSVPLHLLLLIIDFVQLSWRLLLVCFAPPSVSHLLCKEKGDPALPHVRKYKPNHGTFPVVNRALN